MLLAAGLGVMRAHLCPRARMHVVSGVEVEVGLRRGARGSVGITLARTPCSASARTEALLLEDHAHELHPLPARAGEYVEVEAVFFGRWMPSSVGTTLARSLPWPASTPRESTVCSRFFGTSKQSRSRNDVPERTQRSSTWR